MLSMVFLLGSPAISYAFYAGSYGFYFNFFLWFISLYGAYYGVYDNAYVISRYFLCFL